MSQRAKYSRPLAPLSRYLMVSFAVFTLVVSALFGLFAVAFVYTVEDKFLEAMLRDEAKLQQSYFATHGRWPVPQRSTVVLHTSTDTMPSEVKAALAEEPRRREFVGEEGRHYHLISFAVPNAHGNTAGEQRAWLLAEVSGELVVRPRRDEMLRWFVGWGVGATLFSLLLAVWLARRVSAPIERLAKRVEDTSPEQFVAAFADQAKGSREVAQLAHAFNVLAERTRAFIDREQRFTRDASHELRTPISVLRMSIERLQSDPETPHHITGALATMQASLHSMQQTVDSLLVLARENEAEMRPTVTAVLPTLEAWVVANEHWLSSRGATLDIDVAADATLPLSSAALHVVIANLLGNAIAHGVAGTSIRIAVRDNALTVENRIDVLTDEQHAASDSQRPGHGLGLAIVRRTLERYAFALLLTREQGVFKAVVEATPSR